MNIHSFVSNLKYSIECRVHRSIFIEIFLRLIRINEMMKRALFMNLSKQTSSFFFAILGKKLLLPSSYFLNKTEKAFVEIISIYSSSLVKQISNSAKGISHFCLGFQIREGRELIKLRVQ